MSVCGRIGAVCIGMLAAAPVAAQTDAQCTAAYAKILPDVPAPRTPCPTLARAIAGTAANVNAVADLMLAPPERRVASVFSPRDLQPTTPAAPSTAGTAAQGQAIPSVQPTGLASGTTAMVGTRKGDQALAALGVNPAVLLLTNSVSQRLAQSSRISDFSVYVPTSNTDVGNTSGKLKYIGARMRLNLLGKRAGDEVWSAADELVKRWISGRGADAVRIRALLADAPDFDGCVNALYKNLVSGIASTCGKPFTFGIDQKAADSLKVELTKVRNAADAKYFGADVRADFGDPTLGAVANSAGRFWFGGLAGGVRLDGAQEKGSTIGLRGRLGLRYAKLDSVSVAEYAGEGGVGIELAKAVDDQELNASAGVEARWGNAPANTTDLFQTNFVMLRGSLQVPIFGTNSMSISLGVPVAGSVASVMSVNFNWGLLLPDARKQ